MACFFPVITYIYLNGQTKIKEINLENINSFLKFNMGALTSNQLKLYFNQFSILL